MVSRSARKSSKLAYHTCTIFSVIKTHILNDKFRNNFKLQAIFGHQSLPTKYLCHKNFLFPSCPWADQNIPSIWLNSIWACYRWEILWPVVNVLTRYFNLWNRWLVAFGLVALLNGGWVWTFFSHKNLRT